MTALDLERATQPAIGLCVSIATVRDFAGLLTGKLRDMGAKVICAQMALSHNHFTLHPREGCSMKPYQYWVNGTRSQVSFLFKLHSIYLPCIRPRQNCYGRRQKAGPIATWQQSRAEDSHTQGCFGAA